MAPRLGHSRRTPTRSAVAVSFALGLALVAPRARADEKQVCVGAYERAQQLRMDAKLRSAREQLAVCSRPECPTLVRQDCSQWMTEVMQSLPSIVVAARDAQGRDVLDVRVSIDGAVVANRLDGRAIPIDPGPHKITYETSGQSPIEEKVLLREGERNRQLTVTFKNVAAGGDAQSDSKSDPDAEQKASPGPPILAYTLIGVGVVALGTALFFDLKANGDAQTLRDTCGKTSSCAQSDVDAIKAKQVVAGVSLGVGIVSVGVGTVLLLTRPSQPKTTAWTFDVAPMRGGGIANVGAVF